MYSITNETGHFPTKEGETVVLTDEGDPLVHSILANLDCLKDHSTNEHDDESEQYWFQESLVEIRRDLLSKGAKHTDRRGKPVKASRRTDSSAETPEPDADDDQELSESPQSDVSGLLSSHVSSQVSSQRQSFNLPVGESPTAQHEPPAALRREDNDTKIEDNRSFFDSNPANVPGHQWTNPNPFFTGAQAIPQMGHTYPMGSSLLSMSNMPPHQSLAYQAPPNFAAMDDVNANSVASRQLFFNSMDHFHSAFQNGEIPGFEDEYNENYGPWGQ